MPNTRNKKQSNKSGNQGSRSGEQPSRGAQRRAKQRKQRELSQAVGISPVLFWLGAIFLAVATISSGMLVYAHLLGATIPGCGEGSPCAQAAASVWGSIPGIGWPTSFVGTAYFLAMLIAWVALRNIGVPPLLAWIARLGVAGSVFLTVVILFDTSLACQYCLVAHACNIGWLITLELSGRSSLATARGLQTAGGTFIAASLVLLVAELTTAAAVRQQAEDRLTSDIQQMEERRVAADSTPDVDVIDDGEGSTADVRNAEALRTDWLAFREEYGFRGEHVYGPENAPMRIVLFSDYQCPDCKRIEGEILELINERDDLSMSHKHFPMNSDCNPHMPRTLHGNACWAARAAEAASILRGEDGFWEMHYALFEMDGSFTNDTFPGFLRSIGYDPQEFIAVMMDEELTVPQIVRDCDEAIALGLHFTPMVFLNGVQITGWNAPNAIRRAVEALASSDPPSGTHFDDHPPMALEKLVNDWKEQRPRNLMEDSHVRVTGPADAPVQLVVFGNYQGPSMRRAEQDIRAAMATRPWVRYTFRHYPIDNKCNPRPSQTLYEQDCDAAHAVEAAYLLKGNDGFWQLHEWLYERQGDFARPGIWDEAARHIGVRPQDFRDAMTDPEVQAAVMNDVTAGRAGVQRGVPALYVNGRFVPRFRAPGGGPSALADIFDAAYEEETGRAP